MYCALVARDIAPSLAFDVVYQHLQKHHYCNVKKYLGFGKPLSASVSEIKRAAAGAAVVLVGMSSSRELAKEEIAAVTAAKRNGVPYGFYADTYGMHNCPWFAGVRDKASFLFVVDEEEAADARQVFPKTVRVIASGNPLWENFSFPKLTRTEVRQKLNIGKNKTVLLCTGEKTFGINKTNFTSVLYAIRLLVSRDSRRQFYLVFSLHPGDQKDIGSYGNLKAQSPVPISIVAYHTLPGADMIPGCDIVITSISTIGIEAAFQRKPVIDFLTRATLANLKKTTGRKSWKPCELGVSKMVYEDTTRLAEAIEELLTPDGFAPMLAQQKKIYPPIKRRGRAVYKIAETIRRLL
jgi:hypothetical protein